MITSTDPIADLLSRIRNAVAVNKNEINMPHSKIKESVAKILRQNNYIDDVRVVDASVGKTLVLSLNSEGSNSRITEIVRLSSPGRRQYTGHDAIPTVRQGRGMVIISTSQGIMTGKDAKSKGVGGELICRIY